MVQIYLSKRAEFLFSGGRNLEGITAEAPHGIITK